MKILHLDLILLILTLILSSTFQYYYLRTLLLQFQFVDHYHIKTQI